MMRLNKELDISGKDLVTFMSGSVAARLADEEFWKALLILCSDLSPRTTVGLMKNGPFVSRLSPPVAHSAINIVSHLDTYGFSGSQTLKSLIGNSPLGAK